MSDQNLPTGIVICHDCFAWDLRAVNPQEPPSAGSLFGQGPCPKCGEHGALFWDGPMDPDTYDDLKKRYLEEISQWDWDKIRLDAEREPEEEGPSSGPVGRAYLGSIFFLTPSGKMYTSYAHSNVAEYEAYRDEAWYEALEEVADEHTMWIESGEGSADDLFACCLVWRDDGEEENE